MRNDENDDVAFAIILKIVEVKMSQNILSYVSEEDSINSDQCKDNDE